MVTFFQMKERIPKFHYMKPSHMFRFNYNTERLIGLIDEINLLLFFVFADVLYDGCQLICTGTICTVYLLNNRNNT
jgi:hypothetical protein